MNFFSLCGIVISFLNLILHHIAPDGRQTGFIQEGEKKKRSRKKTWSCTRSEETRPFSDHLLLPLENAGGPGEEKGGHACLQQNDHRRQTVLLLLRKMQSQQTPG